MTIYSVYNEIAELISNLYPEKVLALKANAEITNRLEFLVEKSKTMELDKQEKDELDHYIVLERLMRMAKIRSKAALA
jgi:hypothetical protein